MNKCPTCGTENGEFKFGKLYQCLKCKNHFYGPPPEKQPVTPTVEEVMFEERIQERNKRKEISSIEMEILKLANEAREEEASREPVQEDSSFVPMKSPGRPKKAQ